jgi:hypothetical protein
VYQRYEHHMRVAGAPADVFPLLCPVREHDWIEGWSAEVVRSASGVAERGCVFRAVGLTWVVHTYEPPRRIGFALTAPERFVELLDIEVAADGDGSALTWRRDITGLCADGDGDVARRLAAWPQSHRWLERALDHYLATGQRMPR